MFSVSIIAMSCYDLGQEASCGNSRCIRLRVGLGRTAHTVGLTDGVNLIGDSANRLQILNDSVASWVEIA